jgi:hypothetical protein
MPMPVTGLILFLGIHLLPTRPGLRFALVHHWGEQRYKGVFSLVALAGLGLIVGGYAEAAPGRACSSRHRPRARSRRMRSRCHSCSSRRQIFAATSGGCSSIRC